MLREFLWRQQDPDCNGLFYNPEGDDLSASETSKYLDDTSKRQRPRHVDLFCQRAPMMALTTLLAAGDEHLASGRLRLMVRGLSHIAEWNGDEARFASYRWAPVIRPEWKEGTSAPERWIGYRYALMTGLARYVELSGDPEATRLALGLTRYYMRHGDVPESGRGSAGDTHSGGILPTVTGIGCECIVGRQGGTGLGTSRRLPRSGADPGFRVHRRWPGP